MLKENIGNKCFARFIIICMLLFSDKTSNRTRNICLQKHCFETQNFNEFTTVVTVSLVSYISFINPFEVGDLISFGANDEICRIQQIGRINTNTLSLILTRGVYQDPDPIALTDEVKKVTQVQIYEVGGNRLQGVPRGLVLVKETGQVLRLDSLGYVVGLL